MIDRRLIIGYGIACGVMTASVGKLRLVLQ